MASLAPLRDVLLPIKYKNDQPEIINDNDALSQMPDEVLQNIFGYLSPAELARNAQVSRKWHRLSKDPKMWNEVSLKEIAAKKISDIKNSFVVNFKFEQINKFHQQTMYQINADSTDLTKMNFKILLS